MAGIYVHIPFCKVKCHYCDFHFSTNLSLKANLLNALKKELSTRIHLLDDETVNTIYFGGGTPSIIAPEEINNILQSIRSESNVNTNAEVTLEANPDDITSAKLRLFKKSGINRLSIGIQSFNQDRLEFMNRAHNSNEAKESLSIAKAEGFDNITMDLIYGLPNQSEKEWEKEIETFLQYDIPHLSAYCLTIEPKTYFGHLAKKNELPLPTDEMSLSHFKILISKLKESGFEHYEISNFAKPGFISKHNSAYWRNEKYLGIGPSAHSFFGNQRAWNISNNGQYIKLIKENKSVSESETLSTKDQFNEYILTRLRTKWGINTQELTDISAHYFKQINSQLKKHCHDKLIVQKEDSYFISDEGKFVCDNISASLFVE